MTCAGLGSRLLNPSCPILFHFLQGAQALSASVPGNKVFFDEHDHLGFIRVGEHQEGYSSRHRESRLGQHRVPGHVFSESLSLFACNRGWFLSSSGLVISFAISSFQ